MRHVVARTPFLGALLALSLAGCQTTPPLPGETRHTLAEGYEGRRPADVAVLAATGEIPADMGRALRDGLRALLLERRYAPVRAEAVDRDVRAFRPGGENAVMEVRVTRWDASRLGADGTVLVSAELRLYGAGSAEPLYRASLRDVVVAAGRVPTSMEERPPAAAAAAAELAGILLAGLPAKGDG